MALYTYTGNKTPGDTTSRVVFSTGKDMVIGETLDLTAGEVTEGSRAMDITLTPGTVATSISFLNFPSVQKYVRLGGALTIIRN
jgi:hypothetical protein